jgi:membrane protein
MMNVLAPVKTLDRFQQRHKLVGIPIAVLKKFSDDQAGNKAALIAYFAFFSIFPLLLVFVTILGFVLHSDPGAQRAVLNSVLKQFPIIGDSVKGHSLKGERDRAGGGDRRLITVRIGHHDGRPERV